MTQTPIFLLIPAGGLGLRMGGEVPKQFRYWGGMPLLKATVLKFFAPTMPPVSGISFSVPPDRIEEVKNWHLPAPAWVVQGGETRQHSVAAALAVLPDIPEAIVLIHDAVRPFPPTIPIQQAIAALETWDGAVLGEPSTDTLKRVDAEGRVLATESREHIFRAQTPQVARLRTWRQAFKWAKNQGFLGTDDVSILEAMGLRVKLIPSSPANLKLTTPEDWERYAP